MVLEATFLVVDTSEYMRNGDLHPTRMASVQDACNVVAGAKTQMNQENCVGVITMGGRNVKIQETLSSELTRVMAAISRGAKVSGELRFADGINIAALGLKHRPRKESRSRIIAFVGSPITETAKELEQLGKKLKKNSTALDVISFGTEANTEKLEGLIKAANSQDNSHLLCVPEGVTNITDALIGSPIVAGEDGSMPIANADDLGAEDPDLAMALRLSLEEERRREEGDGGADGGSGAAAASAPMDEDEELQRALQMSMAESQQEMAAQSTPAPAASEPQTPAPVTPVAAAGGNDEAAAGMEVDNQEEAPAKEEEEAPALTEEEELAMALKMSEAPEESRDDVKDLMEDEDEMEALKRQLEGADE